MSETGCECSSLAGFLCVPGGRGLRCNRCRSASGDRVIAATRSLDIQPIRIPSPRARTTLLSTIELSQATPPPLPMQYYRRTLLTEHVNARASERLAEWARRICRSEIFSEASPRTVSRPHDMIVAVDGVERAACRDRCSAVRSARGEITDQMSPRRAAPGGSSGKDGPSLLGWRASLGRLRPEPELPQQLLHQNLVAHDRGLAEGLEPAAIERMVRRHVDPPCGGCGSENSTGRGSVAGQSCLTGAATVDAVRILSHFRLYIVKCFC